MPYNKRAAIKNKTINLQKRIDVLERQNETLTHQLGLAREELNVANKAKDAVVKRMVRLITDGEV